MRYLISAWKVTRLGHRDDVWNALSRLSSARRRKFSGGTFLRIRIMIPWTFQNGTTRNEASFKLHVYESVELEFALSTVDLASTEVKEDNETSNVIIMKGKRFRFVGLLGLG